jgi:hypothetical protein
MKFCHLQINGWTGEYHLKWSQSVSEAQKPHVFSHMCNLDLIQIR